MRGGSTVLSDIAEPLLKGCAIDLSKLAAIQVTAGHVWASDATSCELGGRIMAGEKPAIRRIWLDRHHKTRDDGCAHFALSLCGKVTLAVRAILNEAGRTLRGAARILVG